MVFLLSFQEVERYFGEVMEREGATYEAIKKP